MGWQDAPIVGAAPAPAQPNPQAAPPGVASAWSQAPLDPTPSANPFAQFAPSANPFAQFAPNAARALDKYQQAAADKLAMLKAAGWRMDQSYGPADQCINGMTMGALPTIMGALTTPASMIEHGTWDPSEGYAYAKAQQNALLASGNAEQPITNGVASLAGGITTGALAGGAGLTFVPQVAAGAPAPGLLATAAGMGADGAAYGGITGFNSGEGTGRLTDALGGAAMGGVLGTALPVGMSVATSNPIVSQISARLNPQGFASSQLARAIMESGKTPEALQGALDDATAAGQPNFALADALGNPGQRMLSTVTKSPGPGRTAVGKFLEDRQAGQSGDVSNILAEALGAPKTAAQTTADLTAQRTADADVNYGAARTSPNAVDVTPAIAAADQILQPGVTRLFNPNSNIADNSIESAVAKAKAYLTDGKSNLSDFSQVLQAKMEIGNLIENGSPSQQQALIPIKNALDAELVKASPAYANARDTFAAQSNALDAIPLGTAAASGRVRAPDAIGQFNGLASTSQQPFRVGFSDPVIAKAELTPYTANAARPILNDAMQAKLSALSLHNGPYQPGAENAVEQRLGRENTMFETRRHALGGSSSVENMNDQHAGGIDPLAIYDGVTEGPMGMIKAAATVGRNFLGGSTPAVRSALGPAIQSQIRRAALARLLTGMGMGGAGGLTGNLIGASTNTPRLPR